MIGELDHCGAVARRVHRQLTTSTTPHERLAEHTIRSAVEATAPLLSADELVTVVQRVEQLLFGLGPLESLLADAEITELMVNGPGIVWVERHGELARSDVELDGEALRVIVDRIVGPLGLRVDRTAPFVDARLPDGSRVNIAVPPLAVDGPYLTIRRFRPTPHTLADFCTPEVEQLLIACVRDRQSVVISGGTGSGKTSLLNALAAHIDHNERVLTIEDAAELRLPGEHTVRLEARPANAEGVGQIAIRDLVRNALRMRPDRLIVGEVRGPEALDMIQAMNTGHDGSMSTCHANSPLDAIRRIQAMVLMGDVQLPAAIVREHLWAALDLVIHVARARGGKRQVRSVYRCAGDAGEWLVTAGVVVSDPSLKQGAGNDCR